MVVVVAVGIAAVAGNAGASSPQQLGLAFITGGSQGKPQVVLANADGSNPNVLTSGALASLSPNGALVAVVPVSSKPALTIYSASGQVKDRFFSGKQFSADPLAWSRDSRYLAVQLTDVNATTTIGKSGLAVIDTRRDTATIVAHGIVYGASWSPSGADQVVFGLAKSQSVNAAQNLERTGPTGNGLKSVTTGGHSLYPVWGKLGIAFDRSRSRGKQKAPAYQVYLKHGSKLTGLTRTRVGPLVSGLVPLAVSSNGKHLVCEFEGEDTDIAYTLDIPSRVSREIKIDGQTVTAWGISRDGQDVLVDAGGFENPPSDGKVESFPFDGGTVKVLEAHGNFPSWNL
jgi:hypothetical protein